jgi:uncharacterized cupredoxin-like copper-binding protein
MRSALALLVALVALVALVPSATAAQVTLTLHVGTLSDGSGKMYAKPATMTANAGDTITLTVVNDDVDANGAVKTPHDIVVDGMSAPQQGGECKAVPEGDRDADTGPKAEFEVCDRTSASGTFTVPSKGGSFDYHCEVPGHEELGMKGTLTVQGSSTKTPGFDALPLGIALLGAGLLARRKLA